MNLTLLLIHKDNRVLLGMKKRGFGKGFWNGFGGKIHRGETILDAAIRECQEESGVTPHDSKLVGLLTFTFESGEEPLTGFVFRSEHFTGTPKETEEMRPKWFHEKKIPFDSMWPDDRFWFPHFLEGKKFVGSFHFTAENKMLSHSCHAVETLDADVNMVQ